MIGQVAQFLWVKGQLSQLERLSLTSFAQTGYITRVYTYDPDVVVPHGVEIRDGNDILPAHEVFLSPGIKAGTFTYAPFADRFRYHLLLKHGGWWFDIDMISVRVLPEPTDILFASTWEDQWGECASNCAIYCKPGDSRIRWLSEQCDRVLSSNAERDFLSLGPALVQTLVTEQGLRARVAPWWEFCPYPWRVIERTAQRDLRGLLVDQLRLIRHVIWQISRPDFRAGYVRRGTRCVHLHNEIWRAKGLDKNAPVHRLSVLGRLAHRYAHFSRDF